MRRLTARRLREVMEYDAASGKLTWKKRVANTVKIGEEVGGVHKRIGYRTVRLDGRTYLVHRLTWLFVHGWMPHSDIDHIDGDKTNNAVSNLRLVTHAENLQNYKRANSNNRTGLLGVSFNKNTGRYQARIRLAGVSHSLGTFADADKAHEAYVLAKRKMHPKGTL